MQIRLFVILKGKFRKIIILFIRLDGLGRLAHNQNAF